ncbi:MAG: DNA-processing protein DprA [bacterium]
MISIDQEDILRLLSIPGIGSSRIRALIGQFRSISNIFKASIEELISINGFDQKTAKRIKYSDGSRFAKEQLIKIKNCGAKLITFWDEEYPENLKHIYDPPAVLFVRGGFKKEDMYSIAIVGTRQPSNYGKLATEKITTDLARKGLTIVSGLAYGIDTLAHTYALQAGSRTIAVLGSGVDVIYPSKNKRLSEKIISNGALVTEFPMGTDPEWKNFPRRNRIICGLSCGTVVIEAGEKSGALITAAMALEQNREVFAVPGNIDNPKSFGTNELIKQGAKLVNSAEDILEELMPQLSQFIERDIHKEKKVELTDEEKQFLNYLSHEPKHIDSIAMSAGKPTSQVLSLLLSLELKEVIKQLSGKMFVKI